MRPLLKNLAGKRKSNKEVETVFAQLKVLKTQVLWQSLSWDAVKSGEQFERKVWNYLLKRCKMSQKVSGNIFRFHFTFRDGDNVTNFEVKL